MSHREKLEQILDLLINEEAELASEMLHQVVVEKAREIYEELVEDEDMDEDKDSSEEEVDESFGGDVQDNFAAKIKKDNNDIDADELYDDSSEVGGDEAESSEEGDDAFGGSEEGEEPIAGDEDVEDRVSDLETALVSLRAEFDRLMADEVEEPQHADLAAEYGDEFGGSEEPAGDEHGMGDDMEESMFEATKFLDTVADSGMGSEGHYSGTGSKSSSPAVGNKTTPVAKGTDKMKFGQGPTDFSKSSGNKEGKEADKTAQKKPAPTNVNVKQGNPKADLSGEGKFSGTGAHTPKGAVNTKSPLTKKPN